MIDKKYDMIVVTDDLTVVLYGPKDHDIKRNLTEVEISDLVRQAQDNGFKLVDEFERSKTYML